MAERKTYIFLEAIVLTIFCFISIALSDDTVAIPSDKQQLNSWFGKNIQPVSFRKGTLDPALQIAESKVKVIKVRKDGSGNFKTINDAINSIPNGNTNRVIIHIGGGNYTEKVKIPNGKPFITLYGDPKSPPYFLSRGTAKENGGFLNSATLNVESNYFSAVNLNIVNLAPRPKAGAENEQAVALSAMGDKASFYNCKIFGYQDTLFDGDGKHFFKDCYIEGTVDFIFGNGKSLYLNSEIHVVPGDKMTFITAHSRGSGSIDTGYSFVHCKVTGTGSTAFLGRAWRPHASVVFAYTDMSNVVNPKGWPDNSENTVFFGEYQNSGPGSNMIGRVSFTKKLMDARPFITLGYIDAKKWLLPPPQV